MKFAFSRSHRQVGPALAGILAALAFPRAAFASNVTITSSAERSIQIESGDDVAAGYQFTIPASTEPPPFSSPKRV